MKPRLSITRHAAVWLAAACMLVAAPDAVARETIMTAAVDDAVWLVIETEDIDSDAQLPVLRVLRARPIKEKPKTLLWRTLPPIVGSLSAITANRDALYLFFSGRDVSRLSATGAAPISHLPDDRDAVCWAGDVTGSGLAVLTHPAIGATNRDEPDSKTASSVLYQLAGGAWVAAEPLPDFVPDTNQSWLAMRDETVLLVWRERIDDPDVRARPGNIDQAPARLRAVEFHADAWSEPQNVLDPAGAQQAWFGWPTDGPLLVIAELSDGAARSASLRLVQRREGVWTDLGLMTEGGGAPAQLDVDALSLAPFEKQILLARIGADGDVQTGRAPIDNDAVIEWDASQPSQPKAVRPWSAWAGAAAMFILVGYLLMLRPDRLTGAPELPRHLTPALPIWRMIAALLDALPALFLSAYWWMPLWTEWWTQFQSITQAGQTFWQLDQELSLRMADLSFRAQLVVVIAYAFYCFVWEVLRGTTPGKYLMGFRVVDERGGRPTVRQLATRNAMRVVEFCTMFVAICTLFVVLVMSQRRQRIGDLMARTIVVAPSLSGLTPDQSPPSDDSSAADQDRDGT
ncbi:MAG: RDD family protein [Phycisphaerae bacterium]